MAHDDPTPIQILFVCTANICRSPSAEALARRSAGSGLSFGSAGFLRAGARCPEKLVREAARQGIDLSSHRSRLLDVPLLQAADLVVTMEAAHVREVTVLHAPTFAKTVPLVELERTLRNGSLGLSALRDRLERRQPSAYLSGRTDDDVADPYGGNTRSYRRALAEIEDLVRSVTRNLVVSTTAGIPAPRS